MKIPEPTITIGSLIDAHHEAHQEPPRQHMGCSTIGHPCERYLWLSFRWAVVKKHEGRILRLFRRGQLEEKTIVADLRAIGLDVRSDGESQTRVDFGCHISGSIDAIIESGVPEAPKKRHIAEFKTHSRKSFDELVRNGVEQAKNMHFVQMQLYMHGTGIDRALYVAVCKDDDRIYTERVRHDKKTAEYWLRRAENIVLSNRMQPPQSTDPSWWLCKMCDMHTFCHGTKKSEEVNCRTCAKCVVNQCGTFGCADVDDETASIPVDFQRTGCSNHKMHQDLM